MNGRDKVSTQQISRRRFLALSGTGSAAALLATAAPAWAESRSASPLSTSNQLTSVSATALAKTIRDKQVSAEEVVDAYLKRIEAVNPKLNAIVQLTAQVARQQAKEADTALAKGELKGPLHGVPFTVKDNIETAGVVCTAGTTGRATFIPTKDATVVARLRAAGAILLGKTNLPELAMHPFESDNLVYGRTNNPYDLSRGPGGSSGGEAAIIAAGGSAFGIGNDVAGSLRLPAHFCGIVVLKPTSGRVPRTGMFPPTAGIANPLWQQGPMARSVADLGLILPIITGEDGYDAGVISMPLQSPQAVKLKNLRVAYYTDNGIVSSTLETQQTVHKTAQALAEAGLIVEEKRPPHIEHSFALLRRLVPDSSAGLRRFLQTIGTTEFHRGTQQVIDESRQHASSTTEYMGWLYQLDLFHNGMLAFMQQYDVILSPTCVFPALSHDEAYDEEKYPAFSYAATYNLTGWPASVVRAGSSPNGLPIGVQIVARPWREDVALAVAQHIETAFGSWQAPAEKIVNALG